MSANALPDLAQRGKRNLSIKTSPKNGVVPLLPYGLVDQDGADEASGSGSGWSSNDDYAANGHYLPGPASTWSLSPQTPLEVNLTTNYPSTAGPPVPQTCASAYQPTPVYCPPASSSTSSRSSIASQTTNKFPSRFAFNVPTGVPAERILGHEPAQRLMPAWSPTPAQAAYSQQPPAYEPIHPCATRTIYNYASSPVAFQRPSEAGNLWASPVQQDDTEIVGATGWSLASPSAAEPEPQLHQQHSSNQARTSPYPLSPRPTRGVSYKEPHPVRPTVSRQLSLSAITHVRPSPYDYPLQQKAPLSPLATLRSLSASQIPTISSSGYCSPSGQSYRAESPVAAAAFRPPPAMYQPVSPVIQINGHEGYFDIKPRLQDPTASSTPGSETAPRSPRSPYDPSAQSPYESSSWGNAPRPQQPVQALGQLETPAPTYRRAHGHGAHRPWASVGSTTEAIAVFNLNDQDEPSPQSIHATPGW